MVRGVSSGSRCCCCCWWWWWWCCCCCCVCPILGGHDVEGWAQVYNCFVVLNRAKSNFFPCSRRNLQPAGCTMATQVYLCFVFCARVHVVCLSMPVRRCNVCFLRWLLRQFGGSAGSSVTRRCGIRAEDEDRTGLEQCLLPLAPTNVRVICFLVVQGAVMVRPVRGVVVGEEAS